MQKVILNVRSTKINANKLKLFTKKIYKASREIPVIIKTGAESGVSVTVGSKPDSPCELRPTYMTAVSAGSCCLLQGQIFPLPAKQSLKSPDKFFKVLPLLS